MAEAVRLHDEVVRSCVTRHDGYVFSTTGDGFAIAFTSPLDALTAAVDTARAMAEASWPDDDPLVLRMSLHVSGRTPAGRPWRSARSPSVSPLLATMIGLGAVVEPTLGCRQYADRLAERGYKIGRTTVQKHLVDHGLGRRSQRIARAAVSTRTGWTRCTRSTPVGAHRPSLITWKETAPRSIAPRMSAPTPIS